MIKACGESEATLSQAVKYQLALTAAEIYHFFRDIYS